LYNWTGGVYVLVGTEFDYHESFVREMTVLTAGSEDFTMNGTIVLLVNDTLRGNDDNKDTLLKFDYIALETSNPVDNASVQVVRGGGELHVRNSTSIIVEVVDKPFTLKKETFFLWSLLFFLALAFFARNSVFWFLTGLMFVLYGLFGLVAGIGIVNIVFVVIGLVCFVVGLLEKD